MHAITICYAYYNVISGTPYQKIPRLGNIEEQITFSSQYETCLATVVQSKFVKKTYKKQMFNPRPQTPTVQPDMKHETPLQISHVGDVILM